MIIHDTQIRVRYGETDQMGFLYHSHYVDYFDVGRTELMRHIGIPNTEVEAAGTMLPVVHVEIDYKNPAHYDDLVTVRTILKQLPGVKIRFDYEVYRENGELITTGAVVLAFMHTDTKKACRPPALLMEKLAPFFK